MHPSTIRTRADLTRALVELYHRGGWSRHRLAEAAGVSSSTIQAMLLGTTLPQGGTLRAIVIALGQEPEEWLAARGRITHREKAAQSSDGTRDGSGESANEGSDQSKPAETEGSQDAPGRWVDELDGDQDALAFEVHPAIAVQGGGPVTTVLPRYVPRAHDERLRLAVDQAVQGRSQAMFCLGGPSTGKSRACWEAVQRLRGLSQPWRIWHPLAYARPQALLDGLSHVAPRTVIWLNEAQLYLLTDPSQLGESVCTALSDLVLAPGRGPVLVLGTAWSQYVNPLLKQPDDAPRLDRHPAARRLLEGRTVSVPSSFVLPKDVAALRESAEGDARLAAAVTSAQDGEIIQYLAGGPALLERFEVLAPEARALVTAATDCRRLDVASEPSGGLLVDAASGYLSRRQRNVLDDDWAGQALADVTATVVGAVAPLTRVRPDEARPGAGDGDVYEVADYLRQHVAATRVDACPPLSWWSACSRHLRSPEQQRLVGVKAKQRRLLQVARECLQTAYQAGHSTAIPPLVELLAECEDLDGLEQVAVRAGSADGLLLLAQQRARRGEVPQAREAWQTAITLGSTQVDWTLEYVLAEHDPADAVEYLRDLARAGDGDAPLRLARLLRDRGRPDDAVREYRALCAEGSGEARIDLAKLLADRGAADEAVDLLLAEGFDPRWLEWSMLSDWVRRIATPALVDRLLAALDGEAHPFVDYLQLLMMDDEQLAALAAQDPRAGEALFERLVRRRDITALEAAAQAIPRIDLNKLIDVALREGDEPTMRAVLGIVDARRPDFDLSLGAFFLGEQVGSLLARLGETDRLVALTRAGHGCRPASDYFLKHGMLDEARKLGNPSSDKYLNKRLAWLLAKQGEAAELRHLAALSRAAAKVYPQFLLDREDWDEIGRLTVGGDGYMQKALHAYLLSHPLATLSERAQAVKQKGFLPDGSIKP